MVSGLFVYRMLGKLSFAVALFHYHIQTNATCNRAAFNNSNKLVAFLFTHTHTHIQIPKCTPKTRRARVIYMHIVEESNTAK